MSTIFHCADPDTAKQAVLRLTRGSYQRGLIRGDESWNGSTLRGKAKDWSARYHHSRTTLLIRLSQVELILCRRGPNLHVIDFGWCLVEGLRGLAALGSPIGGPELLTLEIGTECLVRGLLGLASASEPNEPTWVKSTHEIGL